MTVLLNVDEKKHSVFKVFVKSQYRCLGTKGSLRMYNSGLSLFIVNVPYFNLKSPPKNGTACIGSKTTTYFLTTPVEAT